MALMGRTGYAGEQLASEIMDLAVRKWHEIVALQEVEDTRAKQIHDDANMTSEIKAVAEMYTTVSVFGIVCFEGS